jgi:hypothetical protein
VLSRGVLLLISISSPLLAQAPRLDKPNLQPEALNVLAVCQAAMGPVPDNTIATASMVRFDDRRSQLKFATRGTSVRIDEDLPSGRYTRVSGKRAKGYLLADGKRTLTRFNEAVHNRPEYLPSSACVIDIQDKDLYAVFHGTTDVRGVPAFHVEVYRHPDGPLGGAIRLLTDYHVFIDANSGQILKLQNLAFSPNALENNSKWEVYFSDYRPISNVLVPFKIERFLDGQRNSEVVLSHVDLSANNPQADFE